MRLVVLRNKGPEMWQCLKCREKVDANFDICWNCGTSKDGVQDPEFVRADDAPLLRVGGAREETAATYGSHDSVPNRQYEFSAAENARVARLAFNMQLVGLFLMAAGVWSACLAIGRHEAHWIEAGVYALLGWWTLTASSSFQRIVDTEGSDIDHLMGGVDALARAYWLQCVVIIIGLVVVAVWLWLS